jgi:histidinol-phosphate aminotransferase
MIRPRKHLFAVERDVQPSEPYAGQLQLNMNEYHPHAAKVLYDEWRMRVQPEVLSAYPKVNSAYQSISHLIHQPIDKLVLTNGADGVVLSALQAFCNPGDLVGYVAPTYGMYQVYADMLNLKTQRVLYNTQRQINREEILRNITPAMSVFLLANPNGIFGDDLGGDDFIPELVEKGNETGTVVVIDEVYADFIDGGHSRYMHLTDVYDNLVIARSFSKSYGLAGVRVGYSLSNPETRRFLIAVRNNVEISSMAVEAINVWCSHPDLLKESIDEILDSKKEIAQRLKELGVFVLESAANFIVLRTDDEHEALCSALQQANIAVKWFEWHSSNYLRVTIGVKRYMRRFVDVINAVYGG